MDLFQEGVGVRVPLAADLGLEPHAGPLHALLDHVLQADEGAAFSLYPYGGILGTRLEREGILRNVEWSLLNREGVLVRFQENAILAEKSPDGSPRVERIVTDITRVFRMEEEIRRIRQAEVSGDALSSAVHSLKRLGDSLDRSGTLLKDSAGDRETVEQVAETLLKDADRSSKHVRQLLSMTTRTDRTPAVADLKEILAENGALLHSLAGKDIDLDIDCSPERSLIMADRQEIIQLMSNFIVSFLKTLPLGGAVSVTTENVEVDASASGHPPDVPSGMYVRMTIREDGYDVHYEKPSRFSRMIVGRMGGWLDSAGDPQGGNLHTIYFPRVLAFAPSEAASPQGPAI